MPSKIEAVRTLKPVRTLRQLLALGVAVAALLAVGACTRTTQATTPASDPASVRNIDTGELIGFGNSAGGHSWLGIPYAAPPVGELRWRAPRPAAPWSGRREALAAGNACIQYGSLLAGVGKPGSREGSEDCLYLNVYAPKLSAGELTGAALPVMVWIHGGGNTTGHAAFYNGQVLAERERVLVVMLNYRLGPFGWFVPPENPRLTAVSADPDLSGNYGNLDVLAALRWVRANAAAFGGNPQNVTVLGESAGGTNAVALLVTPAAEGLFHRLIVQSMGFGFARTPAADSGASPEQILRRLLIDTGKATDASTADALADKMSPAAQSAFLRSLEPWTIYGAYRGTSGDLERIPSVFQDGRVIRAGDVRALLADPATHIDVPTILGTNRDEPKIFMAFDERLVRTAAGLPVTLRDAAAYDREARYRALVWKADAVDSIASVLARHGAPAWAYRWDWDEQGKAFGFVDLSRIVGAAHGLEIPFVFGFFDVGPMGPMIYNADNAAARTALSERMMAYWAGFARDGKPGRGSDGQGIEWTPWTADAQTARMIVFDTPRDGGIRMVTTDVSRETVLAQMEREALPLTQRCALFRATFRNRVDEWAESAWQRFGDGGCVGARLAAP
ncbi:MAG: carboxylesterase/lipase family protein [Gammaproteobacteria bacterium]|jgi:para-nitrobenzyl esterase